MFNMGFLEIVAIGAVALIVIGPKQLPGLAKSLGKMIREFKQAAGELSGGLLEMKDDIESELNNTDISQNSVDKVSTTTGSDSAEKHSVEEVHKDVDDNSEASK